jgi:hypothetical protein
MHVISKTSLSLGGPSKLNVNDVVGGRNNSGVNEIDTYHWDKNPVYPSYQFLLFYGG